MIIRTTGTIRLTPFQEKILDKLSYSPWGYNNKFDWELVTEPNRIYLHYRPKYRHYKNMYGNLVPTNVSDIDISQKAFDSLLRRKLISKVYGRAQYVITTIANEYMYSRR